MNQLKRLYIFTGKGGVGKSTLALSFCELLKKTNKKCLYVTLDSNKLGNQNSNKSKSNTLAKQLNITSEDLDLVVSVRSYIAKKLGSETVAKWIVKTPFFQSLVNMIPGFSYVIYLGHLLEKLIENPELIIVLDSPSSGHALTMLESTKNFNEIFEGGVIYEDTKKMLHTLTSELFTQINIITIPTRLAISEANELKNSIESISDQYSVKISCNNCLSPYESTEHPDFLFKKIQNEKKAINESESIKTSLIPHSLEDDMPSLVKDLVPSVENLV